MPFDLERARISASTLNEQLRPIAEAKVDVNDPRWAETMRQSKPLDELGIRAEAEALFASLLDAYEAGSATQRIAIRQLFREHSAFVRATGVNEPPTSANGFRRHLLRLAVATEGEDLRDIMMLMKQLYETANAAGVSVEIICSEVASLSDGWFRELLSKFR